ncbi:MAG: DEAD/DEAH box helicase family protein [Cyclobacteriaceae bacterium]|nr:MAG: DEAD/DEAH box helicase family protein [Cyclobacteriaceae bacterium]
MSQDNITPEITNWKNPLEDKESVQLAEYLEIYQKRILQESEKLFVQDFLFPLLGKENIKYVIPQYPFIDSEGRTRRIDFALVKDGKKLALEVNGETYHAEGIIPNEMFDDNLNRQNEILNAGWHLLRYSFSQLQHPEWRTRVSESLRRVVYRTLPELLSESLIEPNFLQREALNALDFYRNTGWKKGIIVLPTGTGKTFLSAFDTKKAKGRILFIVHRLDILSQSREAFEKAYPKETLGLLTGDVRENLNARILFASKDTLRNPNVLYEFSPDEFDYIIVDEVHHGQAPSYQIVLEYFQPNFFMLGLTATPDRMDRKDIFELFDYQKVFEYTLNEAIENGFLVPYNYYGLKDNIDYSKIRYKGNKYNVADLDRYLIIEKRNEQILKEYLEKGNSNKAVGFCCSVKHAEAMAEYFTANGIPSYAITSQTPNREDLIKEFRENKFTVAFTVDLFNEGVDFPDLRVLLFLRPTESKTVFVQQLGRGLRLCSGKDNVVILDFISNYQKANKVREYLAKGKSEQKNGKTGRVEKVIYEYSPNCEVHFDAEVEQILDSQDKAAREITKEDLIDAYYTLAETLGHKPTQQEINEQGEFKVGKYQTVFGSWIKFLREIGEFTEASYHFPQGLHLGHILYILKTLLGNRLKNTHLDSQYIRLRGNLDDDRLGAFQRQTKYKLQGLMELGLLVDDRKIGADTEYHLQLTPKGKQFAEILRPVFKTVDLSFKDKSSKIPSWEMNAQPSEFNEAISKFIQKSKKDGSFITRTFLEMHAVGLMLNYLYRIERKATISKSSIYQGFFNAPFIASYCDQNGIEAATETGAEHRCPFLLNILEALGIIKQGRSDIELLQFVLSKQTIQLKPKESEQEVFLRIEKILHEPAKLTAEEVSLLKESFGKDFLTKNYFINNFKIVK